MRRRTIGRTVAATVAAVAGVAAAGIVTADGGARAQGVGPSAEWHLDTVQQVLGTRSYSTPDSSGTAALTAVSGEAASLVPGRFGNALQVNGSAPWLVSAQAALEPQNVTVLAWVERSGSPGQFRYVIADGARSCAASSYALYTGGGGLAFYIDDGNQGVFSPSAGQGIWDGSWHMVAGTFDGQTVRLYVDGSQIGSGTRTNASIDYAAADNHRLSFGNFPNASSCGSSYDWSGDLDEARIYPRALTATEIAYLATATGPTPPELPPPATSTASTTTRATTTTVTTTAATTTTRDTGPRARLVVTHLRSGQVVLDGSTSGTGGSRIVGYSFSFGSGSGETVTCGPDSPVVQPQFAGPVAGHATLRVTAANGRNATTSVPFSSPGLRATRSQPSTAATQPLVASQCLPKGGLLSRDNVPDAAGRRISSACEVDAGIVQADGCSLTPVSNFCTDVPAAERALLEAHASRLPTCAAAARLTAGLAAGPIPRSTHALIEAVYVSKEPIRVNGLDVVPLGGSSIVLAVAGHAGSDFPLINGDFLVGSDAVVALGRYVLAGPKTLDLEVDGIHQKTVQIASFSIKNPITLGTLGRLAVGHVLGGVPDLPVEGGFAATLVGGGATQFAINVTLNKLIAGALDSSAIFTGATTFETSNHTGPVLDELHITAPEVDLGLIDFKPITLDYVRKTSTYSGTVGVVVPDLAGSISGTFHVRNGVFQDGAANYTGSTGGGIQIAGPVFLTALGAKFSLYQSKIPGSSTSFDGTATFSIGPAVNGKGCGLISVVGDALVHFYPSPFAITATGKVALDCMPVGERYFVVNSDGVVELGQSFDWTVDGLGEVTGNIDGQAYLDLRSPPQLHVQLDGSASATFAKSIDLGIGSEKVGATFSAEASISDRGAGLCGHVVAGPATWTVGVGESFVPTPPLNQIQFLKQLSVSWDGCDLSPYRTLGAGGPPVGNDTRATASATRTFALPASTRTTAILLRGRGGAPAVTLHGPGGRTVDATKSAVGASALVLRQPSTDSTLIELRGGEAGAWTMTPAAGSPPVVSARRAFQLPPPRITANVTGTGSHRVLHYSLTPEPGRKVTFVEVAQKGAAQIGPATRAHGAIPFIPSGSRSTRRTIVAHVTQNGEPSPSIVVAHYAARAPLPGRPSAIRVHRSRGGLLVSFRPAPLALRHLVAITLSDGRSLLLATTRNGHTVSVPHVAKTVRVVRLEVTGLRFDRPGPAAVYTGRR